MVGENSWRVLVKPTMQRDRHRSVWYALTKEISVGLVTACWDKVWVWFVKRTWLSLIYFFYLNHFWDLGPRCYLWPPMFVGYDSQFLMGISTIRFEIKPYGLLMFKLHWGRWMKTKLNFQRIGFLPMDLCLTLFDIDWFSWKTHMISGQIIIYQQHEFSWNISATWIFLK